MKLNSKSHNKCHHPKQKNISSLKPYKNQTIQVSLGQTKSQLLLLVSSRCKTTFLLFIKSRKGKKKLKSQKKVRPQYKQCIRLNISNLYASVEPPLFL